MSNEIATTPSFLPIPKSLDEAWKIAQILSDSDMVPKDFKGKPGNCLIAMQWGSDIGIPGIQALQNIAVINGRPSIWGDAAKALVIGRADCEDIQEFFEGEGDKLTAVCVAKRKGKSPITSKFSLADAKLAGLLGKAGPWTQYRNRMLQMRARGFALRDAFPDALKGLTIAEEAQDMPTEKEINPPSQPNTTTEAPRETLDELLVRIKTMSINDFKNVDPAPFTAEEKSTLRKAMTARRDEINAEKVVADIKAEPVNWEHSIKECGDAASLQQLILEMPDDIQLEYGTMIDEKFDSFR